MWQTIICFLTLIFYFTIINAEYDSNAFDIHNHEECIKSSGMDTNKWPDALNPRNILPFETLCFIKCVNEQFGVIQSDGTLDLDLCLQMYLPEKAKPEAAKTFTECLQKLSKIATCEEVAGGRECYADLMESL